ncbi:MAG: hypothetical protein SGCHY_002028, partial [Lobulomycetales sp.]
MLQRLSRNAASGCMVTRGFERSYKRRLPWFHHVIPRFRQYLNSDNQWIMEYDTICIDVPVYLEFLISTFLTFGGSMKQKTVKHIRELWSDRKGKVIVVNCSGLGAHFLGGVQDKSVYPTR